MEFEPTKPPRITKEVKLTSGITLYIVMQGNTVVFVTDKKEELLKEK